MTARDLVSEPANVLFPKSFADKCTDLRSLGVNVKILDESEMIKLGMGALIGVAQGVQTSHTQLLWTGIRGK